MAKGKLTKEMLFKARSEDVYISKGYANKAQSSMQRGIPFTLTFAQYKRIIKQKKCFFTGIELTHSNKGVENPTFSLDTDFTLDRINNKIGYTKENTVACCHGFNNFKAIIEAKANVDTLSMLANYTKGMAKVLTSWVHEPVEEEKENDQ